MQAIKMQQELDAKSAMRAALNMEQEALALALIVKKRSEAEEAQKGAHEWQEETKNNFLKACEQVRTVAAEVRALAALEEKQEQRTKEAAESARAWAEICDKDALSREAVRCA